MMNINVNGKEYKVEFSFGAAECKEIVQKMFSVVNGSYLLAQTKVLHRLLLTAWQI